jgi:bifunctional ADP-heptose synthase (sugar kinase/adenylyltransferase)
MAGLALGTEAGMSISASTRTANKLAGIAVSHNGTYTITGEDWIESIKVLQ